MPTYEAGGWVDKPVDLSVRFLTKDDCLTARDVSYARRWFTHQHFYSTTPTAFVDDKRADGFFDELCDDNALSVQALKKWAAWMFELDNPGEEYES